MLDRSTGSQQSPAAHAPNPGSSFRLFQITRAAKAGKHPPFPFLLQAGSKASCGISLTRTTRRQCRWTRTPWGACC